AVINALNQRTEYQYDVNRNLTRIIDARNINQILTNIYNPFDQIQERWTTLGFGQEVYSYDGVGNLKTKRDYKLKVTTYNYDPLMSRMTSIVPDASLSEPTTSFTYKPNGQRHTMTDASGVTTYGYDNRNRLTSKQTPFGTLSYSYDAASNLETMQSSNANGVSVSYRYDVLNRVDRVTDNRLGGAITDYQFDEVGNLKQSNLPNGVQNDYSYNSVNLLTQLNVTKGASNLARYIYSYTPSRLRSTITELSGRSEQYEYDDANQLTKQTIAGAAANQNGTVGYVLDAVGNRLQRNSTIAALATTVNLFNNKDQLDTDGYDANGNTLAADGKTFSYTYDNRLKTVNGNAVTLAYDGNNNRVSKTVGGVTTNYLVDELSPSGYAQVVEELVSGQVQKSYTWGHMLINQRRLVAGNYVASYYGQDGSENIRQLFDNAGTVTDTFAYDAFGILIGRTGATANSYLYRSQQFDADLGFYYNRARYYDQTRGRFLNRDEFEGVVSSPRSLHKYLYGNVDPVNLSDPSGYAGELAVKVASYARIISALGRADLPAITRAYYVIYAMRYASIAVGKEAILIAARIIGERYIATLASTFVVFAALLQWKDGSSGGGNGEGCTSPPCDDDKKCQGDDCDKKEEEEITIAFRGANGLSPSAFRRRPGIDDAGLSLFESLPPGQYKYAIPFTIKHKKPKEDGVTGSVIAPILSGLTMSATYDSQGGALPGHWLLNGENAEALSAYAKEFVKNGEQ
ncbi:MAG: RHS repeat-associated core domain-containing protein, partial [Acidobacteria bacterium]|nr:RHS repeat-associated core domain-containing protein [Acidobacteriota bacterium]